MERLHSLQKAVQPFLFLVRIYMSKKSKDLVKISRRLVKIILDLFSTSRRDFFCHFSGEKRGAVASTLFQRFLGQMLYFV